LRIGIVGLGQGVAHLHAFRTVPDVQIVALAQTSGLAYQQGNQVRYAPCLVSAKALIDSGRFGDIFYSEAEYLHNMAYAQYSADGKRRWRASHWTDLALPAAGRHGTMELAQAADFVRAIRDRRSPPIDAWEAARSCLPLWAALESSRTGRPVAIEPIP